MMTHWDGHFQHGMIWVYGVARIAKEDERWWDDVNHAWKTGAPENRTFKLLQDLKDKCGEDSGVHVRAVSGDAASDRGIGLVSWPPCVATDRMSPA
jgi:hypothetical protein